MANLTRENLLKQNFSDPQNYPYGFSRSGDFSINEAKSLSQYGCLFAALMDGEIAPETPADHQFLQAAYGNREPETIAERAWTRYQKRINRPKLGSVYGSAPAELDDEDESTLDTDTEIEIDTDD